MKRVVTHLSLLAASAMFATGCVPVRHNLPPEQRLMEPGPGVGGPGPGVLGPQPYGRGVQPAGYSSMVGDIGGMPIDGGMMMSNPMMVAAPSTVQVTFGKPDGMQIRYDATGSGRFDSDPLFVPARQNFPQGGLFRIKLTNIPGREGVELYPTVELAYGNPRTGAYLAHNSIPLQFTDEDFDQVVTGNFVTKVIYLPDPDFQGPALAGIDTLVSTRLDPSIDPIVEADNRGSILAIIRLGDKDIEMAGTNSAGFGFAGGMGVPVAGLPAPFAAAMTEGCGPVGGVGAMMPPQLPGMISGMNAPQYGMPITGTPIGLPGPPHIPLGSPAGLKKHVIRNHTPMHIPQPVSTMRMSVRQQPGQSYPNPVSRVRITEQNINPGVPSGRPLFQGASQQVDPHNHQ